MKGWGGGMEAGRFLYWRLEEKKNAGGFPSRHTHAHTHIHRDFKLCALTLLSLSTKVTNYPTGYCCGRPLHLRLRLPLCLFRRAQTK
ncbi:hypothetical protein BKA67DRAFT_212626 [Truncatella angustata]|uniref:Uncharacterized protein n=1 Tax=Truncatella angustata TaxID=152316 RepID=A0A9P8USN9_9PEZI|nr:uncharacterized protein BKA67DRAFT_212626 [Truncatella angustata]KAH6658360.1 hypothetical protein BKA67DRAFT_212626 [Truncatella angustata]